MTKIIQTLFLVGGACGALAQGVLVLPGGRANIEGNSSSTALVNMNGSQYLQVYSASGFTLAPGERALITSVSFRVDGTSGQSFNGFGPDTGITLGTTTRGPDSLSPIYSDDIDNGLEVHAGSFIIHATNTSLVPRSFLEVQIPFARPFEYDPSRGNLSMYIGTLPGTLNLALDAQDTFGDGIGRVFGPNSGGTGTADTVGFITQFQFNVVPEPDMSTFAILAIVITALMHSRAGKCGWRGRARCPQRAAGEALAGRRVSPSQGAARWGHRAPPTL